MITEEQLQEKLQSVKDQLKPFTEEFEKHKKDFDNKAMEIEKPFHDLLELYYDEKLIDENNKSVKKGNTITNGKVNYYVEKRGMQFLFGQMMFNPRVMVKKVDENGRIKYNAKEKHIHPSELKEYWIL